MVAVGESLREAGVAVGTAGGLLVVGCLIETRSLLLSLVSYLTVFGRRTHRFLLSCVTVGALLRIDALHKVAGFFHLSRRERAKQVTVAR